MRTLLAAMITACLVACGMSGPGMASPLKKLSFAQTELFKGNPRAPELYRDLARLFKVAEQQAIARLLPPRPRAEVIAAPAILEPEATPGDAATDDHNI